MKAVKTFEEACQQLGYDPSVPSFNNAPEKHRKALKAHYQLIIITEAVNDGWQPDWSNSDEYKYELWLDVIEDKTRPSGFGLSFDVCGSWDTDADVGARLCFVSREAARHCFETFKSLWEDYMLIG